MTLVFTKYYGSYRVFPRRPYPQFGWTYQYRKKLHLLEKEVDLAVHPPVKSFLDQPLLEWPWALWLVMAFVPVLHPKRISNNLPFWMKKSLWFLIISGLSLWRIRSRRVSWVLSISMMPLHIWIKASLFRTINGPTWCLNWIIYRAELFSFTFPFVIKLLKSEKNIYPRSTPVHPN